MIDNGSWRDVRTALAFSLIWLPQWCKPQPWAEVVVSLLLITMLAYACWQTWR